MLIIYTVDQRQDIWCGRNIQMKRRRDQWSTLSLSVITDTSSCYGTHHQASPTCYMPAFIVNPKHSLQINGSQLLCHITFRSSSFSPSLTKTCGVLKENSSPKHIQCVSVEMFTTCLLIQGVISWWLLDFCHSHETLAVVCRSGIAGRPR